LIHDTNRDLYIVLTRYGRIGETGVNQRTPFNDIEEAKKEFSTIYKQKSSNEWDQPPENFVS
jgi:poly [ADP-ribose] polymerase/centrosomal protein CEP128